MFQKSPVEDQKGTEKPNHVFFSTKYTWVFDLPSLDSKSPGMFMFHPRWCPNVINCFINPMNTIDISHIYHLYITHISPIYHLYITNKNNSEIGVICTTFVGDSPDMACCFPHETETNSRLGWAQGMPRVGSAPKVCRCRCVWQTVGCWLQKDPVDVDFDGFFCLEDCFIIYTCIYIYMCVCMCIYIYVKTQQQMIWGCLRYAVCPT